jgi:hypothetical protein
MTSAPLTTIQALPSIQIVPQSSATNIGNMYYDTSTGSMMINTGNGYHPVQGPKGNQGVPGPPNSIQRKFELKIIYDQRGHCMIAEVYVSGSSKDEAQELGWEFVQWCNENDVPWHGDHSSYSSRYRCSIAHFDDSDLLQMTMRWS